MFAFMNTAGRVAATTKHYLMLLVLGFGLVLQGCGGGGGGGSTPTPTPDPDPIDPPTPLNVGGGGVKGPLSNAIVTAYLVDTTRAGFKGSVVDTATTDATAAITGLALPLPLTPPYILEFTSDAGTTDITTGKTPVITTLRTVVTQAMLDAGIAIYASPQTTMATDIAIKKADSNTAPYSGNNNGTTTSAEFLAALPTAAGQVMSTLGFGASSKVDIFTTPPLINGTTGTTAEQTAVAEYRTAIEALTAVVYTLGNNDQGSAQSAEAMLTELTADLSDGAIDGKVNGVTSTIIDAGDITALIILDPATLPIPNSDDGSGNPITVADINKVLVSEKTTTGTTTTTTELEEGGGINITPTPAIDNPDTDGDNIPNFIDNCPAVKNENQTDTDGDLTGDACDTDDDNDTVLDVDDNCPLLANQEQTDNNENMLGDACEAPPVASGDTIIVAEGAVANILSDESDSVLANDSDAEGDSLTAVLDNNVSHGTLNLELNGTFSYAHDGSENLTDSFSYHVNDGASDSATVTVSITITPVDDPAVLADDTAGITEDATPNTVSGNVLNNDSDPDSALSVSNAVALDGTGSYGTLHIDATGAFSYELNNNNATVTKLTDGASLTETYTYNVNGQSADLVITISGVDDPTVLTNDTASITEDGLQNIGGNVLGNDSDPDTELTVNNAKALSGITNYGEFFINGLGKWSYTLDNNNAEVQKLNDGETLTEMFAYEVNGKTAQLVITINGVTDGGLVDLTGVWELNMTHVSETGPGCAGRAPGETDTFIVSFVQSGTNLTAIESGGVLMTGTINETTGTFTITGNDIVEKANLNDPADFVPVSETVSTVSITATGSNAGNITSGDTVTVVDKPGTANECTATRSVNGSHLYRHTGSENYNGVYAFELLFQGENQSGPTFTEQETFPLEMVVNGSTLGVHIADYPDETFTISATSFEPATGFFQFTLAGKGKYDYDGDGIIDGSDTHRSVVSGILVNDPAISKGTNGAPLASFIEKGYEHSFNGDVDAGGTPVAVSNYNAYGYGKMLTTGAYSRTQRIRNADQTDGDQIKIGVLNVPLRRSSPNSKLYLQVKDDAAMVLCTVPYFFDGIQKGHFVDQVNQPAPDMNLNNFRSGSYSRVTCNTNDVDGVERVVDGANYQVQIIDTGDDGLPDGVNDSVIFNDPAFIARVAGTSGLPEEQRYSITPRVYNISVNGATSSTTLGGSVVPLSGYFDISEPMSVSWPELANTDNYQLRLQEEGNAVTEYRYSTTIPSAVIDAGSVGEDFNLRLVANNTVAPPTGATAQAYSRKLNIAHGIRGLFDIELGGVTDLNLETFQVNLHGNAWGMSTCDVMNNPAYSCNPGGSSINFGDDIVTLSITDHDGAISGTPETAFTLQLHFKTTGVISSGTAVVTSTDDAAGIADTPDVSNASARMVNPELRIRSFNYNGIITSRVIMLNPIDEAVYNKAVVKVNDDSPLVVNGVAGATSGKVWDDNDGNTVTDFGNRFSSYVQYPTDDGQPQSTGRFVSVRSDTQLGLGLGTGLLAADRYKLVMTNPADINDKRIFRKHYDALPPDAYSAPVLDNIVVNQTPCSSGTPVCNATSAVAVNQADVFNLSWTVDTPPAGARWQMVLTEQSSGLKIRSRRMLPDDPGSEITSVDNGATTTYTWTVPAGSFPAPANFEIQLRVSDNNQDVVGLSADVNKVYITVSPPLPL